MIATASGHKTLRKQRIIERPRLIKLLTDSKARVLAFVAPAGYGKTTLADQWIVSDGRSGAWFRARRASTDVAALALDVAKTASAIVPGCDERLREHLRAVPAPGEHPEILAELLGDDLTSWPPESWMVIDEYQEIAGSAAEEFIRELVTLSPINLLVASRVRPAWVTERTIIYGEITEIGKADLAMSEEEARVVLGDPGLGSRSALLTLAEGWPAVIGLAGVSQAEVDEPQPDVESLYRFFAEEIFGALGDEVRSGLLTLALAPVIDHQLPTELLGATAAEVVVRSAVDVGIIVARSSHLEMHPLARSFLTEWSGRTPKPSADKVAMQCLSHYRRLRDWDAAFEVLSRHKWSDELERLAGEALDELLDTARLKTLERWSELASETAPNAHVFSLARAEVALRRGRFTEAQTHGEAAASEPDLAYRALSVAGRAAHLASREEEALEFYEGAESVADDERQRRGARWGQLSCLIDLERAEAASAREALSTSLVRSDPTDVVRCATSGLGYELKCGTLDLAEADRAYELIDSLRDPIARTSFESIYSLALCLVARYDEALVVAGSLLDVAKRYRLDFALPYALSSAATAHAGRREWRLAHRCIEEAVMTAREGKNSYAEHVCVAAQIRILAQQGMHDRALALRLPDAPCPLPAVRAELKVSRALVLASASRLREAVALLDEARDTTRAIEPTVLIKAVDAICALKGRTEPLTPRLREFVDSARNTGGLDLLVTTYRSTPELLPVLLRDAVVGDDVARVVQQVGDEDLAEAVDVPLGLEDRYQLLSRREREVLQCIRDGLSNRQIAETLFISEGTAKAHTHRIFEKLGTSSRVALVVKGLLERKSQATSAIEEADDETDSPLL